MLDLATLLSSLSDWITMNSNLFSIDKTWGLWTGLASITMIFISQFRNEEYKVGDPILKLIQIKDAILFKSRRFEGDSV